MPMTVAIEPMAKARFRNRSRFSNGAAARFSASTNSARNTTAPMKPAITSALPQPAVGPWITANISANRATATVTWPPQSSERPSGDDEFRANRAEAATLISASRPMATGAQRQLAFGSLPYLNPASQPRGQHVARGQGRGPDRARAGPGLGGGCPRRDHGQAGRHDRGRAGP